MNLAEPSSSVLLCGEKRDCDHGLQVTTLGTTGIVVPSRCSKVGYGGRAVGRTAESGSEGGRDQVTTILRLSSIFGN